MALTGDRLLQAAILLAVVGLAATPVAAAKNPLRVALDLRAKYAADIEQLAKWCESNGLADEAKKTRHALAPTDPYKLYVPVLPEAVGPPKLPAEAPPKVVEWDSRFNRLRRDQAVVLFEIARHAVRGGRVALAFDLALAAIQADPNYEPVRRLFGYQKFRGQWHTRYEVKKLRAGLVWSGKFGWLPKSHARRYEEGQRHCNGRWITADDDARRHRNIFSGWNVETEYYSIRTNYSIEAAVALGVKLERLNRLWQEMFVRYCASEADVVALFDGRSKPPPVAPRHKVVYFRDREGYDDVLRAVIPNVEITVGVYRDQPPCTYFFADQQSDDRTLYHEATHQLFHESRWVLPPVAPTVGRDANFWIVEGIAMYMESLRQDDGFYVLGGFGDERLRAAQYRLLHDKFYVPLEEFTRYGMARIQNDPRIATLYSQAAGLTLFLIHYDGGRYRDALVAYLVAVYTGRDAPDTLAKLTGVGYNDLDKQYHEFIEGGSRRAEGGM